MHILIPVNQFTPLSATGQQKLQPTNIFWQLILFSGQQVIQGVNGRNVNGNLLADLCNIQEKCPGVLIGVYSKQYLKPNTNHPGEKRSLSSGVLILIEVFAYIFAKPNIS